jgi:hypothetical protein
MLSGLLIRGFYSAHALLAGLRGLPAASALQRFVLGGAGPYRGNIIRRERGTRGQRRCDPKNRVPVRHRPLLLADQSIKEQRQRARPRGTRSDIS